MSSQQQGHTISPPPVPASPPSTGVRRHHTISASSRRSGPRPAISEEDQDQEPWNDDEVVDEDWVGGVGVVGEKSSLHRQSSLPTRYHRGKLVSVSRFALSPLLIILLGSMINFCIQFPSPQLFSHNNPDKLEI